MSRTRSVTSSTTRPSTPSKARRRLATTVVAGSLAAAGIIAVTMPSTASADGLSTTISRWSSSDFSLGDAANTKLTVAAGIDEVGVVGRRLTTTRTVSIALAQSRCTTGPAGDVLVTRSLAAETPVNSGVSVNPLLGSASVNATIAVSGTETKTPAGTGGDCNETTGPAVTAPITDSVKVNATWSNKPGSSPLVYGDIYQQGVFYYRDAVAKGTVSSASTGNNKNLSNSTGGWLWSGAWVYATGT